MKSFVVFAVLGLALLLSGCQAPTYGSLNIQRSALRGLGDGSVTVSLDTVSTAEQADVVKAKVKDIVEAIRQFLKDGKLADLTIPEFTDALYKMVPVEYRFIVDILLSQIQGITIPTQAIGKDNIKRLDAVCVGILNGCAEYKNEDRPPAKAAKKSAGADLTDFGKTMKAEAAKRK